MKKNMKSLIQTVAILGLCGMLYAAPEITFKPDRVAENMNREQKIGIALGAESNMVSIAQSLGVTNIPIPFTIVQGILINMVSSTNLETKVTALAINGMLSSSLDFYTMNGGDPWRVGEYLLKVE